MAKDDLIQLEEYLGIDINNYALMGTALTHRSYLNENEEVTEDNERLEFLGDAVLDLVVASYLYSHYPAMAEGEMTALRAALVRADSLAAFAQQLHVDEYLRLGFGEAENGGRKRIPTLCAAFEAVIGAVGSRHQFDHSVGRVGGDTRPLVEQRPAAEVLLDMGGKLHHALLDTHIECQPHHVFNADERNLV